MQCRNPTFSLCASAGRRSSMPSAFSCALPPVAPRTQFGVVLRRSTPLSLLRASAGLLRRNRLSLLRFAHGLASIRSSSGRRKGTQCSPHSGDLSAVTVFMSSRQHSCRPLQAISGDLDGGVSKDNMTSDEQTLEQKLQNAIAEENYSLAARLRDALRVLHEDNRAAILAANGRFYDAFCKGDLAAMTTIWSKGDHVQCVHPGAGRICGYDLVLESWELVANADIEFPLKIELQNTEVYVKGDLGYVTCLEVVKTKGSSWGRQVATNVFEKIRGQWLLCIHHASHIGV